MARKSSWIVGAIAWVLLMGVALITAIAWFTSRYGWPIYLELLSHFQLQYLIIAGIAVVAVGLLRRQIPFWLGLFCVALLASQIVPWYWPPKFLNASNEGNLRILIANVNTQNREYEKVLAVAQAENPDLALFMEVDTAWINQLDGLSTELPYASGEGNPYNTGIILYSRYPLSNTQLIDFSERSTRSVVGTLRVGDRSIALVGTHPLPPVKPSFFQSRNEQLDLVGGYLKDVEGSKMAIGDFNMTMWSPYYRRFMRLAGLKNARDGFGLLPSWPTGDTYNPIPSWITLFFSIPIDHCFPSPDLTVTNVRIGPNIGSDHRPVIVDLKV